MRSLTEPRDLNSISLDQIIQLACELRSQRAEDIKAGAKHARKLRESKKRGKTLEISIDGSNVSFTKKQPKTRKSQIDWIQEMQIAGIEMTSEMQEQLKSILAPKVKKPRKKKEPTQCPPNLQ